MSGIASIRKADETISAGRPLPRIALAEPLDKRNVRVLWRGSVEPVVIDTAPAFTSLKIFAAVRTDDALFGTVRVNEDGTALEWADGAELSAMWLEELAEASLSNAQFREAMERMRLTLDGMALHLGVARRLIADYRKDKPIPKSIALATRHLLQLRTALD